MPKNILLSAAFFLLYATAFGQSSKKTMLYILDSMPLKPESKAWTALFKRDIADMYVVTSKDTLEGLGYGDYEGITYIFTKEYRKRPDSLKTIPGFKQMQFIEDVWHWHGTPHTGKFINYYVNGKIMNEGELLNGKVKGEYIAYFTNGNKKIISNYANGILNGVSSSYYTNGALLVTREYIAGEEKKGRKAYFINGQIETEIKIRQSGRYDTAVTYYSTGKIRKIRLVKKGEVVLTSNDEYVNYYTNIFYQSLRMGNMKEANKSYFKLLMLDSTSIDTYYKGGLLMLEESRYDKAISEFDKVLAIEPLMREALLKRALARIKKQQHIKAKTLSTSISNTFTVEDIATIPIDEQDKICRDLLQAEYVDFSETYVKQIIPEAILNYCRQDSSP